MPTIEDKVTELESRLEALEARISMSSPQETSDEVRATNERILESKVDALADKLQLAGRPIFYVAATPLRLIDIGEIFESSSPATKLFENPDRVREEGFNMYRSDRHSVIVEGQNRELQLASQIRTLGRDGTLVALFRGDDDFLGWAMKSTGWPMSQEEMATPNRINSLVLIEATYGVVRLTRDILKTSRHSGTPIQFSIGLRNMMWNGQGPQLLEGKADRNMHFASRVQSEVDNGVFSVFASGDQSPERIAFMLVAEIYRRFGVPDERVPYSEIVDGERRIVPAQF